MKTVKGYILVKPCFADKEEYQLTDDVSIKRDMKWVDRRLESNCTTGIAKQPKKLRVFGREPGEERDGEEGY